MTTAFLGLLAKGSEDTQGYWSSVINITSISGITKLAQNHVRLMFSLKIWTIFLTQNLYNKKFCYNSIKAAASHLTKLLSTEIGLKNIPVRVNSIAPGGFESEGTPEITPDTVDMLGQNILPLPAKRGGT